MGMIARFFVSPLKCPRVDRQEPPCLGLTPLAHAMKITEIFSHRSPEFFAEMQAARHANSSLSMDLLDDGG
jgi:hypothetical protein